MDSESILKLILELTNRGNATPVSSVNISPQINSFGIGKYCIIRTYSAGVHCGIVGARSGTEIILYGCRRIFYWDEAFTLSAVANNGAGSGSKLSPTVSEILLTEAIEVIPCSSAAHEWLAGRESYEP
jgi:nicotinic acid phosphoribosyltransferase